MNSKTTKTSREQLKISSNVHELVGDELYPLPLLLGQESRLKASLAGVVPFAWKVLIVTGLILGARYLWWRWSFSLNTETYALAVTVVMAETLAFIGVCLLFYNLWDKPKVKPANVPVDWSDCSWSESPEQRPLSVDVLITTYDESPAILADTLEAANALHYPYEIEKNIWVLDDGDRSEICNLAHRFGVNYLSRQTNEGFKAGNLENALRQTNADFFVICDADTKLAPNFLSRTLGYFRDRKIAWVQCPHWFTDTAKGHRFGDLVTKFFGKLGASIATKLPSSVGGFRFGADPLQMDQHIFFVNIMSPRNRNNAAFCCGAASVHRRAALEDNLSRAEDIAFVTKDNEGRPTYFNYHVSEDLYTSMRFHADKIGGWKSVQIDEKIAEMQSPQDMLTRTIQRFKYAGGSMDLLLHKGAPFQKGFSLPQRLMYGTTFFFYLSFLWNLVFLSVPAIFLLTGFSPINRTAGELLTYFLPYYLILEVAFIVGFWGQNVFKSRAWAMADFSIQLAAFWTVIRGREIKFKVTPKQKSSGMHLRLIWPHILFFVANLGAVLWALFYWITFNEPIFDGGRPVVLFWALFNAWNMWQPIQACLWLRK